MISPWFANWYINRIWCDQQQTNKKIVEHVAISMLNESMTKHNWDSSQMTIDRQYLVESINISWHNVSNRDRKWLKSLWLIKQFTGSFHMRAICIKIFVCCECESFFCVFNILNIIFWFYETIIFLWNRTTSHSYRNLYRHNSCFFFIFANNNYNASQKQQNVAHTSTMFMDYHILNLRYRFPYTLHITYVFKYFKCFHFKLKRRLHC